jgi:hypothetical protein
VRDADHFDAIRTSESVRRVLAGLLFEEPEVWCKGRDHNDGMKITKRDWTIPCPGPGVDGVNVHYEMRRPGAIQIDVEIFPYRGSIDKDVHLARELKETLALKGQLLRDIRVTVLDDRGCVEGLGATAKGLRDTDATSSLCAVQFLRSKERAPAIEFDSAFVVRVLETATPIVDEAVRRNAIGRRT